MKNFIEFVKLIEQYKEARGLDKTLGTKITFKREKTGYVEERGKLTQDFGKSGDEFIDDIKNSINQAKIFRIDDNIKKLLALTKVPNKNDMIRLPFPCVFIDASFDKQEFEKLGIDIGYEKIIGILLREGVMVYDKNEAIMNMAEKPEQILIGKDLRFTIVSKPNRDSDQIWFDTFNTNVNLDEEYKNYKIKIRKCESTNRNAKQFIHLFCLAFLNFVNNPEVKLVETSHTQEQNIKRIKRGKIPIPSSYSIRLDGVLKEYIDSLRTGTHFDYHYRFWCRGHFRTLRHPKYKENVGKRIWIPPYIKGKGVLIEKYYKVV